MPELTDEEKSKGYCADYNNHNEHWYGYIFFKGSFVLSLGKFQRKEECVRNTEAAVLRLEKEYAEHEACIKFHVPEHDMTELDSNLGELADFINEFEPADCNKSKKWREMLECAIRETIVRMTDEQRFLEFYRRTGIVLRPTDLGSTGIVSYRFGADGYEDSAINRFNKFGGYNCFYSSIEFTKEGKFIRQDFWE